jgi:membrane fusion protein
MTLEKPLFRPKAVEAQKLQWLGEIVMIRPTSFTVLTWMAVAIALVVIGFLFLGSYTKRSTVTGQLVPASGQVKVYVPQPGIVLEKFVHEGQMVQRGQRLLSLSSERYGSDAGPVQAGIVSAETHIASGRQEASEAELASIEQRVSEPWENYQSLSIETKPHAYQ